MIATTFLSIPLDALTSSESVRILSREILRWMKEMPTARTAQGLAQSAGRGRATVARIISRETVQPRFYTVIALYKAIGFSAVRFDRDQGASDE